LKEAIQALLRAAVQAPSGDNTQPWRFVADFEAPAVEVHLDPARDRSPMNAGQRMARIAIGAAIENLLATARGAGWDAEIGVARPPALARIDLKRRFAAPFAGEIESVVAARVTNRRLYEKGPVWSDVLFRLKRATEIFHGVATHWIVEEERVRELADLIARADASALSEPSIRQAFLSNVRFDRPANARVEEGLSVGALELSSWERFSLQRMSSTPGWLLRLAGTYRVYAAHVGKLVRSASGLCLVVAPDGRAATDLSAGRAMQRAWLTLTREGLAAQPMMTLLVLEGIVDHGLGGTLSARTQRRLSSFREELRRLVPEIGAGRPAFLLRFGYAPAPSGRTGRLPAELVTEEAQLGSTGRQSASGRRVPSPAQIRRIVAAGSRGPSGENCQPWRFRWSGGQLSVSHDRVRAAHNLDANYHSSYLTLGCLLEAIQIEASAEGFNVSVALSLPCRSEPEPPAWARVRFAPRGGRPDELAEALSKRCTDRRLYRGGSLEDPVFAEIVRDSRERTDCGLRIQNRFSQELLGYLKEAETYVWRHEAAHQDLMRWIRFGRDEARSAPDGLPWPSLAIGLLQSRVLRLCRSFSIQRLLNGPIFLRQIRRLSQRQVTSSAALLCVTVTSTDPEQLVEAGRLGFRAWLRLNQNGYGVQPMTIASCSVYNSVTGALPPDALPEFVKLFRNGLSVLRRAFGFDEPDIPVWMFRTGLSPVLPQAARTRRLDLAQILTIEQETLSAQEKPAVRNDSRPARARVVAAAMAR
jgi:nitroreductase